MLETIRIQNFKSIVDLKLELGRVNVFIGENGSGKSNILEALAFLGAGFARRLSNEFLFVRGIRESDFLNFLPLFEQEELVVSSRFSFKEESYPLELVPKLEASGGWSLLIEEALPNFTRQLKLFRQEDNKSGEEASLWNDLVSPYFEEYEEFERFISSTFLKKFFIYSPEESALRNFYKEGQIRPLGVKGDGLFNHLQEMEQESRREDYTDDEGVVHHFKVIREYRKAQLEAIYETLELLGWFDSMEISPESAFGERKLNIVDHYLKQGINLDHRSVNEGFLFILFYATLLVSDKTPKFFAIDNIDASLNPKLCAKLMERIAYLASERMYNKQVICTTHNPAILDGLDLKDPEQRLFVVSRGIDGETLVRRITEKKANFKDVHLSEAMLRGYLGGLPENF